MLRNTWPLSFMARRNSGFIGAPLFVGAGTLGSTETTTTMTPGYPAGISANDILFMFIGLRDGSGNATISSVSGGWTLVEEMPYMTGSDETSALYWKRATGSESGTETVTLSEVLTFGNGVAQIVAYRGCVTSGTPYERNTLYAMTGSSTTHQGKGLTTAGVDRRAVSFFYSYGVNTTGSNNNGWTEDYEGGTITGEDGTISVNSIEKAVAGKVAGCNRTMAASCGFICYTLALIPVGGTPGSADPYANILFQVQPTGANGSTAFTDESHYNHAITAVGNAQVQSNKLELDGSGDWIKLGTESRQLMRLNDDARSSPVDFTIDVFGADVDTLASTQTLISFWDSSGTSNRCWFLLVSTAGNVTFQYSTNGSTTTTLINYAAGITTGVAHDYRIVRSLSAGEVYLYIDGTKVATATFSAATVLFDAATVLAVGANNTSTGTPTAMNGRIAAARVSRGALSTGASYTVETLPLATS